MDTTIARNGPLKQINLLFITRKFPPMVGGMERLSAGLAQEFGKQANMTLIAWGGSQIFLPIFLPYAFIKSLVVIPMKNITHIHLGDAVLSPLGVILKKIFPVKVSVTANGLDITYRTEFYQKIIPPMIAKLDTIICISRATLSECLKRGIPKDKCTVISPGITASDFYRKSKKNELEQILTSDLTSKKIIVTVGRLVKRKGVAWFVEHVVPKLPKNIVYVVVGSGAEEERIRKIINSLHLHERVIVLGGISDEDLKVIYNNADLFVMPNRKVSGNMEGFGIVAMEASAAGLPVIATDLEGIADVVKDKINGRLVNHGGNDAKEWVTKITSSLRKNQFNKQSIRKWVHRNYDWNIIGKKYITELESDK